MTVASVLLVAVVAVLAPLLVELPLLRALPVVVVELGLGILAGPVLHLTEPSQILTDFAAFGMAFLFFMGGMEVDLRRISGRPLALGAGGWALSVAIALPLAAVLTVIGLDLPIVFVAAALATTALGTLMPIMRDAGVLPTRLGRHTIAAGMCGELFPIVAISIVLTSAAERALTGVLLVAFALVTVVCAFGALRVHPPGIAALMNRTMHATSQLPVRACLLLLVVLVYLARDFGLDVVLGAFAAGMVARMAAGTGEPARMLEHKLDAVGFGFLIPVFFITTGLSFDLDGLLSDSEAVILVPVFLVAFLAVRGVPALLYRGELRGREQVALAFYSATTLPLVVAITTIGVAGGHMRTETSAALVAAAMLSVVLFPLVAMLVRGRTKTPSIAPVTEAPVPLGA
jgi:Kef-type K+ transport system membrane component KefB